MALDNSSLLMVSAGAMILLMQSDVKQSASIIRRNVRHIRDARRRIHRSAKEMEKAKPKEIPEKDILKDNKH